MKETPARIFGHIGFITRAHALSTEAMHCGYDTVFIEENGSQNGEDWSGVGCGLGPETTEGHWISAVFLGRERISKTSLSNDV